VVNISVADGFTTGANAPLTYSHNNTYEFQDYTSITHKTHFIKFGARLRGYLQDSYTTNNFPGQFNWSSIASYTNFLEGVAAGQTLPQIFAAGYGPFQYTQAQGIPLINANQVDAGLYVQDDWRVIPSITLSLGLRYEIQDNISDKNDWAPRVALAWGIGPGQGRQKTPNTVLRLGYGWFYSRFPIGNTLNDERFNGVTQTTYTVDNPPFLSPAALQQIFPGMSSAQALALGIPVPASLAQYAQSSATYHTDPNLRAGLQMQTSAGIDRALPKNMQMSINFTDTRAIHQLQTVDINTPIPGSYIPALSPLNPTSVAIGNYPYGQAAGVYNLYESGGIYKQNQLIFNLRVPLNSHVNLQGYYVFNHASADSGAPSNPYNFQQDYGRASFDYRHQVNVNGTVTLPWKIRLNPNLTYRSAAPFNITQGIDEYGNTSLNTRPAFEPAGFSGPACTSFLATEGVTCVANGGKYGNFVINPTPGMKIIPINYGNAFSQFQINISIRRTWGFGERLNGATNQNQAQGGPNNQPGFGQAAGGGGGNFNGGGNRGGGGGNFNGGGGGRGGGGGGGGRGGGGGGGDSSGQKYTLTAGLEARNLFNTVNPAAPQGDLLSNRFDEALSLANIGGGNISANRRLTFNLRFSF
jgi:hypothetical protein